MNNILTTSSFQAAFPKAGPYSGETIPFDPVDTKFCFNDIGSSLAVILKHSSCVTWVLDVRDQSFDFISDNTLEYFGYEHLHYATQGHRFHENIKQHDDALNISKLNDCISNVLSQVAPKNRAGYKFSYDYRIIKPNGRMVRILEQNTILRQDSQGNITHLLGSCTDISLWKKSEQQLASLISENEKQYFLFTPESAGLKRESSLSKRELEILGLLAEGRSSKYIADKLFISFHTVNTHRQKMIEKTNTKNTGGLVQFAVFNGLI
jgi:DNA-binding CsgD family transcriptional regulator